MRKYKVARFLAWVLVVSGIASACLFLVFGLFQLLTPVGVAFLGPSLGAAVGGVLTALVGFVFLAFFDAVQAYLSRHGHDGV